MISKSGADSKSTRCGSVMRSRPAPSSNASMGKVRAKVFKPLRRFANTPKVGVRSVMRLMICSERCCRKSSLVASACLPDACHWASSLALRLAYMRSSSLRTSLFSSAVSIARTSTTSLAICSFIMLLFLYETTTGQADCDVLFHFRPTQRTRSEAAKPPDEKKPHRIPAGFSSTTNNKPDNNLLSHWLQHYHRRKVVSRSCSGWEGVGPTCYGHQALTCTGLRSNERRPEFGRSSINDLVRLYHCKVKIG